MVGDILGMIGDHPGLVVDRSGDTLNPYNSLFLIRFNSLTEEGSEEGRDKGPYRAA